MTAKKQITLRYFNVTYPQLTSFNSLVRRLHGKLSSSAAERMMPINKAESNKADLISDYANINNSQMVAGTMLRIINSKDVPVITDDMLKQNMLKISTINEDAKEWEKTCLDYYFFCLTNEKLIITLDARSGISRFETYINWLLNTNESGDRVEFSPMLDNESITVSDIKKITVNNSYEIPVSGESDGDASLSIQTRIVGITTDIINSLFSETDSLKDMMDSHICSANLVIKFSKPRGMDEDEYKRRTAGAILKPLEDPNSVSFQVKGKKIKGSEILKSEVVEVECEDNGALSEQEVYQKMVQKMRSL